jgi:gamma-glutamyltranspeptidase / glutathione hydrolase
MPQFVRKLFLSSLFVLISISASSKGFHPVHARRAIVVSVHEEASKVGIEIIRAGGNAVDAAVATGFALAVVHPAAGNLGGGGFMLFRKANGEVHFLDFREKAPHEASAEMYLDPEGRVTEDSRIGYRSVGVPGTVAGMVYAEKKWGKLTVAQVVEPAIRLAQAGVVLSYEEAQEMRDEGLARFPESKRIFQRGGKFYERGELLQQPELATTLKRIAKDPEEFYHGSMAREIAAAIQKGGGIISAQDLAGYQVVERPPILGTYRGFEIISAPPPSSGGVALIETLNILEGYDLASLGRNSAQAIHLTVEAYRRAFYDRATFMGDPDFAQIPVSQLTDKAYAKLWRQSIDSEKASVSKELQRPAFGNLNQTAQARSPYEGAEPQNTTHYSVVDADGNAASVTTTLNDAFGSHVTLPGFGFLLNDEMDDFSAKPGEPNMFGLLQGPANAIVPGKRPLSTMTPTMVLRAGKLALVLGSPGGPTIITTVANILMNVVDYGMDIQTAVNSARFHHQWLPDEIQVEGWQLTPDTLRLLQQKGHKLKTLQSIGDGECIAIDLKTGEQLGASDGRNNGVAVGLD